MKKIALALCTLVLSLMLLSSCHSVQKCPAYSKIDTQQVSRS